MNGKDETSRLGRVSSYSAIIGVAALLIATAAGNGLAAKKKRYGGCRQIKVTSNYTADTVSGCVRYGRRGPEVRLPSGAWIPCHFGCADTLRSQSIDFWQWIEENSLR